MTTNDNLRGLLERISQECDLGLEGFGNLKNIKQLVVAALAEPDSNDTRRVNDYDSRAFALGYPNVILALAELERLKAEPDSGEVVPTDSEILQLFSKYGCDMVDDHDAIGIARDLLAMNKAPAKAEPATYPHVRMVRQHKHTCACCVLNAQPDATCDCGAVIDGASVEASTDE